MRGCALSKRVVESAQPPRRFGDSDFRLEIIAQLGGQGGGYAGGRACSIARRRDPRQRDLAAVAAKRVVVPVDERFQAMIHDGASEAELERAARAGGNPGLIDDGVAKVRAGLTTVEEVARVVREDA